MCSLREHGSSVAAVTSMAMVNVARPSSWVSMTLRTKLAISTAVILVAACLLLGWVFIQQQVRSAAEGLVNSGTLLAQHLASMGQFSIVAGDTQRLEQLVQEILAVRLVAYATVSSGAGEYQAGSGKNEWQRQFSAQPAGGRQFPVTKLVRPSRLDAATKEPLVTGIW